MQAPLFERPLLDPFPLLQNGFVATEVYVGILLPAQGSALGPNALPLRQVLRHDP